MDLYFPCHMLELFAKMSMNVIIVLCSTLCLSFAFCLMGKCSLNFFILVLLLLLILYFFSIFYSIIIIVKVPSLFRILYLNTILRKFSYIFVQLSVMKTHKKGLQFLNTCNCFSLFCYWLLKVQHGY